MGCTVLVKEKVAQKNKVAVAEPSRVPLPPGLGNEILILVSAPLVKIDNAANSSIQLSQPIHTEIPSLAVWDEIISVAEALKRIDQQVNFELKLVIANANEFREELFQSKRPLIIHFIGHGMSDPSFRGLVIEDDIGTSKELDQDRLEKIISPLGKPPCFLAVLNACHSEILSETLLNAGVRYVVSINAHDEILDAAAKAFTEEFYPTLLNGYISIQQAFKKARSAVGENYLVEKSYDPATHQAGGKAEPAKYNLQTRTKNEEILPFEKTKGTISLPRWNDLTNLSVRSESVFLGRNKDIHRINRDILTIRHRSSTNMCIAIHGMGGMGKTEFAKAVGRWQHERRRWKGGVWFVGLRTVTGATAAWAEIQRSVPNLVDFGVSGDYVISAPLLSERMLIILDDLDNLIKDDPSGCYDLLNSILASPNIQVLTTSRRDIPKSKVPNYPIDLLSLGNDATIEIFREYAHLSGPHEGLSLLPRYLQGYPFPIRLAAAYMTAKRLSVKKLVERLHKSFGPVMRDPSAIHDREAILDREVVLSVTLDLTYNVLPESFRKILHLLAIFPAGMTEQMIEYLEGDSGVDALEGLLSFSMAELQHKDPVRIVLPEPARQYVLDKKTADLKNQYGQRVLKYFHDYCLGILGHYNLAEPDENDVLRDSNPPKLTDKILDERSNIQEFLEWGYINEKADRSICNSARITALLGINYATLTGLEREVLLDWIAKASIAAENLGDSFALFRLSQGRGEIYLKAGNLDSALEAYLKAKESLKPFGEDRNMGAISYQIGYIYQRKKLSQSAVSSYRDALRIFLSLEEYTDAAQAYRAVGYVMHNLSDFQEAISAYTEAIRLFLQEKHPLRAAYLFLRIGEIRAEHGEMEIALENYRQAAKHYHDGRNSRMEGHTLELIGDVNGKNGLSHEAITAYKAAIKLYKTVDEKLVTNVEEKLKKLQGNR